MNATHNVLSMSYHEKSTAILSVTEQKELEHIVSSHGCVSKFNNCNRKPGVPLTASIAGEAAIVVIVIAGGLVAKTLLQEIVKDLYIYFKNILKKRKEENIKEHRQFADINFAIILNIDVEGRKYHVGIDYMDEETFVISFYRLKEYIESTKGSDDDNRLLELEYPKWGRLIYLFPLASVWLFFILLLSLFDTLKDVFNNSFIVIVILLIPSVLLLILCILINSYQKRKFRETFYDKACDWARNIESANIQKDETNLQDDC